MIEKIDIKEDSKDRQVFAEIARVEEAYKLEVKRLEQVSILNLKYIKRLSEAEQKRLDAIRHTDVAALTTATSRATVQAEVLAKNLSESSETLRQFVATTSNAVAEQLKTISLQLAERLLVVEKAQYELKGKTAVEDPQKADLGSDVRFIKEQLLAHLNLSKGTGTGRTEMYGWITAFILFVISVASFIIMLTSS